MTAAVIYTRDLEPITIIEVPMWAWERFKRGEHVMFRVPEKLTLEHMRGMLADLKMPRRIVAITAERLRVGNAESLMLFASDEALGLEATFLPGQRGEVQRRERRAYCAGLFDGFFIQ